MTEREFRELIITSDANHVLKTLSEIQEKDRRKYARVARTAWKTYSKAIWDMQIERKPFPEGFAQNGDVLRIAVLATGLPSEIAKDHFRILPQTISVADVIRALKPSWIDQWAEEAVEVHPRMFDTVQELNRKGLCGLPDTDAYILGYYRYNWISSDLSNETFLQKDVWRFFEVEGGGEFSLASHDKYSSEENSWALILLKLCANGSLDRNRLLDVSLDALERDFGQFRAGWYSRFHIAMAPTLEEATTRVDRYLNLLGSMVPPTVSFALKTLKKIDKAGGISSTALLSAIEPALQARQKSSVLIALQLLKSCAKQNPDSAFDIAKAAASALISESGEVQERALDLIEQLDQARNSDIHAVLSEYQDIATPTVQDRLSNILGGQASPPVANLAYPVPKLEKIYPVGSEQEAVSVFLELLEDCQDPFLMERGMDGLARYGSGAQPLLSPIAKRAKQLQKRAIGDSHSPGKFFEKPISAIALAWSNGTKVEAEQQPFYVERYSGHRPFKITPNSFEGLFVARSEELLNFVRAGHSVPMLSAPTDNRGYLDPTQFIGRLQEYRTLGLQPGAVDFKLALMRLAPEGRDAALAGFRPETEAERALAYAMGADISPEKDKQLWVIAWSSRLPQMADAQIQTLVSGKIAGAGEPAVFEFSAKRHISKEYSWPTPLVKVTPPATRGVDEAIGMGLPCKSEQVYLGAPHPSWMTHVNQWVSILRPAHSELFFATGIFELYLDEKLSGHPCLTFLEPFLRPGLQAGPMAHALLAWYLASADGAIGATTQDAIATLIAQNSFDADLFADAARKLIFDGGLPLRRWTKRLTEISQISPDHASAIQMALSSMLIGMPQDLPRDLGGILELLYELHIVLGTNVENVDFLTAMGLVTVGGKTGKYTKKLIGLGFQSDKL